MKINKLIIIILALFLITGCTKINNLTYDDVLNILNDSNVKPNTYRKGFSFYKPNGMAISKSGPNYIIFSSNTVNYYLYLDFIGYKNNAIINKEAEESSVYFKKFNDKVGYIDIKMWKNNQYLIEIMYNYAKIEVMVDKELINSVLINSINILKSIKYNDTIIDIILNSDNLDYTEEVFDIFENTSNNSSILEHEEENIDVVEEDIKDTDFIN